MSKAQKAMETVRAMKAAKLVKLENEKLNVGNDKRIVAAKIAKVAKVNASVVKKVSLPTGEGTAVKSRKVAPTPGSKSEVILAMLKEGRLTKYGISKELGTYYSVVERVEKMYILGV